MLAAFVHLTVEFGILLAAEKMEGPATILSDLGIELDTYKQTSHLPEVKLDTLKSLLSAMINAKKTTLRQVQSLLGHLNFACRVIAQGRAFCARLAQLTTGGIASPSPCQGVPQH